jgi:cytochrome b561
MGNFTIASRGITSERYSRVAVILHWVTAILMIYMLFWGEDLIHVHGGQPGTNPALHASLGITILALTLIRLAWRFFKPPPADVPMSPVQKGAAHILHWAFYALLILIPLSGLAVFGNGAIHRHPEFASVQLFGLLPVPYYQFPQFGYLHGPMTKIAIGLLIIHVLAALKHQFIDRDRLLARMSLR